MKELFYLLTKDVMIMRPIDWPSREAMQGNRISDEDLAHATSLLHATNAINDTLARARHYGQRAIDALAGLGGGQARAALIEAVEFAVARAY